MNFRAGLPKLLIHLLAITALLVVLPACSGDGDDDLGDPGDGENDTAAPLVVQISPVDGGLIVDLNTNIFIQFNEDMDPSSAAGNITLSPGTMGGIAWANPTAMQVGPNNLPEATEVTFRHEAPQASAVFLAGEFNGWSDATDPLTNAAGVWTLVMDLAPGSYQYKFVVDGTWAADPTNANTTDDGFGGQNSLLKVDGSFSTIEIELRHVCVCLVCA